MSRTPLRIIQITDTHLFNDPEAELLGVKTEESAEAVLQLIKNNESNQIDLIIVTGDLSQDGSVDSYQRLAKKISAFNVPVYSCPGNHDQNEVLIKQFIGPNIFPDRRLLKNNWQIILLDTQKSKSVEGYLPEKELIFLEKCLNEYPETSTVVMFHHQPVPIGSLWLDRLGLKNAKDFWRVVQPHQQIRAVIFGHVHQETQQMYQGLPCYSAPSTCIQFKRQQDYFGLEKLPQGYRQILLYPDGRIETTVKRLTHYIGVFQKEAKGY